MANASPTFEEIDQHISALDLSAFQRGGRKYFTTEDIKAAPGNVVEKICALYRGIRPILIAIGNIPLIPKKWREALKTFTDLMDLLCPGQ